MRRCLNNRDKISSHGEASDEPSRLPWVHPSSTSDSLRSRSNVASRHRHLGCGPVAGVIRGKDNITAVIVIALMRLNVSGFALPAPSSATVN
jgi:hypothetical protein